MTFERALDKFRRTSPLVCAPESASIRLPVVPPTQPSDCDCLHVCTTRRIGASSGRHLKLANLVFKWSFDSASRRQPVPTRAEEKGHLISEIAVRTPQGSSGAS